jgi:long-chain acyl-CoA synthetase
MLNTLIERAVRAHPSKTALVFGRERISYSDLFGLIERCAAGLRQLGVEPGDCVAAALPNCPEFVVGLFASVSIGAKFLPLNPRYEPDELLRFLVDSGASVLIGQAAAMGRLSEIAAAQARPPALVSIDAGSAQATSRSALLHEGEPSVRTVGSGPALYLYTSGSTDTYKRVCCTQENLYWEARNFVETVGFTADDTILCAVPLFHSYGIGNCLMDAIYLGATLVLLPPNPEAGGTEPPFARRCHQVARIIRDEQVRFFPGVPYQFSVLASLPDDFPVDLSSVRHFVSSGDALSETTFQRFRARFGRRIRSLYGSTEAGSIAMDARPEDEVEFGSLGLPLANVTIEVRDPEGNRMPNGVDGEIWVKSPVIPPSLYDNRPDLGRLALRDGYYNTGDIGRADPNGRLILAGRKQSFVNVAGYKVDTAEVEEALTSCPGVREAAAVGVDVPRMGMLVKAAVVADGNVHEGEIRAFCRQRLAFYKVPRLIEFVDALPRSPVGKILKSELTDVRAYLEKIRNTEASRALAQVGAASPARRRALIASIVHAQAAAVLTRTPESVPRGAGFSELGMDSFASIELLARLEFLFECELPQTFTFDFPTVDAVADYLTGLGGTAQKEAVEGAHK